MSTNDQPPRVNVLGVGVSELTLDSATALVARALEQRTGGYVCVTGVHGVMESQTDAALRDIHNHSFLTTPDGMPMVWLGRLHGFKNISRVYGPDLMLRISELTQRTGHTHFIYGGAEGVADELKTVLQKKFPKLRVVGTYTPPFRPLNETEEAEFIARIQALQPAIIWVGLSTPKQEKCMAQLAPRLPGVLFFGVGAAFDFHTGRTRQAPRWMQCCGLEWFFRLCSEPRRLGKRYLKNNTLFLCYLLRAALSPRK